MSIKLPKQAFVALAALGWADGTMKKIESAALVRAAKECGVEGDDLAEIERSTKTRVELAGFDPAGMEPWERIITYALASWLAALDGVVSSDESAALAQLGDRLALEAGTRKRAASAAFDISVLPDGGRPDKYDFVKLVARLKEKLPQRVK
ncbi:MAG: hypothetical protein ABJE95_22395 [Byssovorax sp.]